MQIEDKVQEIKERFQFRNVSHLQQEDVEWMFSTIEGLKGEVTRLNASVEHWSHCYAKLSESKQRLIKQIQNGEKIHFVTLDDEALEGSHENT